MGYAAGNCYGMGTLKQEKYGRKGYFGRFTKTCLKAAKKRIG